MLLSLVFTHSDLAAQQAVIEVLTESTPFTRPDPLIEHRGEATIFVKHVLGRANIGYNISYVPWKRSYQYGLTTKNILIYPIARTQKRENKFIWVGKIIPVNYFLFRLKRRNDINLENIEQAKSYSIGVVNHHAHHEYLESEGFTDFEPVNSSAQNLRKLLLGRIDLFPLSSGGLEPLCKQLNVNCDQIVPAIALDNFSDGLYMAFSKQSNRETVERVQNAYNQLYRQTDYKTLFAHRLAAAKKIESEQQSVD
ncbi:MAG: transporter substrate-binding domain-containing protein [Arenicella sp.]|nr:transporter substrate-binding domain-containing protein [Arenicella sp.]